MSKLLRICIYVFFVGSVFGVGAKDRPLLSSSSSCEVKVRLLRLCTVRTESEFLRGLGIKKNLAWQISLVVKLVLYSFFLVVVSWQG